jgi:hypothetical protein
VWSTEVLDRFRDVKAAFDPLGILNPGVKVALPAERALDAIKYDPTLAPLPSRAHSALERVERDRAYARLRLELLEEAT